MTERLSVSPESARARSNITAVPDMSATACGRVASRWLTTTTVPLPTPGRVAVTVSSGRSPAAVLAVESSVWTLKPWICELLLPESCCCT